MILLVLVLYYGVTRDAFDSLDYTRRTGVVDSPFTIFPLAGFKLFTL